MTEEEASALGYRVVKASPFEVGLIKGNKGIRTWFASDFDCEMPPLGHPLVMKAVMIHEEYLEMNEPMIETPGPTGEFPRGKLNSADQGQINIGLAVEKEAGVVWICFGPRYPWLGLPPDEARRLAAMIIEKAAILDGGNGEPS